MSDVNEKVEKLKTEFERALGACGWQKGQDGPPEKYIFLKDGEVIRTASSNGMPAFYYSGHMFVIEPCGEFHISVDAVVARDRYTNEILACAKRAEKAVK